MRSKLFVPGGRPELFAKAMAGQADAVSFDLEDAVPVEGKDQAREGLAAYLRGLTPAQAAGKCIIVRINAYDSPYFSQDLQALAIAGVAMINVPKLEHAQTVSAVAERLAAAEQANGVTAPIGLLVNIETPGGLANAAALAAAHPRVAGLQLGLGDLFAPFAIARTPANVHAAMFAVRMAAARAGIAAYDGAWPDVADDAGFLAEATLARALGFGGKSCIHPRQVALAHQVFSLDQEALAHAQRVVEAAAAAQARGHGAFLVDGRMVDAPYLARARALVAAARSEAEASG
ncbi:TPA: CoA ester lyase [Pseudomonas aeruginosa]|nr:CoA ester lyase [Pseudomonas aeruginosa]